MKLLLIPAVVALAGCAVTAQQAAQMPDSELCFQSAARPAMASEAVSEIIRRGTDCSPYQGMIAARIQGANNAAAYFLQRPPPPAFAPQQTCRSRWVGNQVETVCF